MGWYVAASLNRLLAEYNKKYPNRSKASDGSIGDRSHANRFSDHNPDAKGCVHARDFTNKGGNRAALVKAAIAHPSTYYVISNGKIYSRTYGFRARRYTGSNGHYQHVHVSVRRTSAAEKSTRSWFGGSTSKPKPSGPGNDWPIYLHTLKSVDHRYDHHKKTGPKQSVKRLQYALNKWDAKRGLWKGNPLKEDGIYGARTRNAVKLFQKSEPSLRSDADGRMGPMTLKQVTDGNRTYPKG